MPDPRSTTAFAPRSIHFVEATRSSAIEDRCDQRFDTSSRETTSSSSKQTWSGWQRAGSGFGAGWQAGAEFVPQRGQFFDAGFHGADVGFDQLGT
jgi:hypothetical protein